MTGKESSLLPSSLGLSADRLSKCLEISPQKVREENFRRLQMAHRNRFLAGLYQGLLDHPVLPDLWMHVGRHDAPGGQAAVNSLHWIRQHPDIDAHEALMRKPIVEEHKQAAQLFRALGATRSAISSTSAATRQDICSCFPAWAQPRRYTRESLMHTIEWLLNHEADLDETLADLIDRDYMAAHRQSLPTDIKTPPRKRM